MSIRVLIECPCIVCEIKSFHGYVRGFPSLIVSKSQRMHLWSIVLLNIWVSRRGTRMYGIKWFWRPRPAESRCRRGSIKSPMRILNRIHL